MGLKESEHELISRSELRRLLKIKLYDDECDLSNSTMLVITYVIM